MRPLPACVCILIRLPICFLGSLLFSTDVEALGYSICTRRAGEEKILEQHSLMALASVTYIGGARRVLRYQKDTVTQKKTKNSQMH